MGGSGRASGLVWRPVGLLGRGLDGQGVLSLSFIFFFTFCLFFLFILFCFGLVTLCFSFHKI